jgi:DNA-binding HxlR family transcriptional regulator
LKIRSSNVDRNYNHNIDEKIKDIVKDLGCCNKSKLFRELQRYFPTISKTTLDRHLDKMINQDILQYKESNNQHIYSLTESAEIALRTGLFENVKPKKQNKKITELNLPSINNRNNNNEFKNNKIAYFLILSQAASGSRIFIYNKSYILDDNDNNPHIAIPDPKNHRKLVIGDFKWEEGITQEDILKKTNITIKSSFPNYNPTKSIIQKKFEELENQYGFKGRIQKRMRSNEDIIIEIVDDYLRQFILWLEVIFHMVEYRIRYGWIWKRRSIPSRKSQEFRWYLSTFGREKTVKVLIEASHFRDYFNKLDDEANNNNNNNKSKLKDQIKTILNHLDKNIVGFYHSFILCDDKYLSEYIKFQRHIEFSSNDDRLLIPNYISKENNEHYQRYRIKIKDLLQNNKEMAKILQILIDEIYYPKFLQHKHIKEGF